MKPTKTVRAREPEKIAKPKKKRNLDNSTLKPFFGKSPENIWEKDIQTGEGNFSF
ncbi:hypothetical protein [Larkinella punicea]|uniref:hypothetical protein n=1 Tax=Larkinella punicea TaxID=2315727 RepID=UPI001402DF77|nr:hypothetical protein [Larkinella punicea]